MKFLKEKAFWINLLISAGLLYGLLFVTLKAIDIYTKHGEVVKVPNVLKLQVEAATEKLEDENLTVVVSDSIYNPDVKPGTVVEQSPVEGSEVKVGRSIFLTVTTKNIPLVEIPDLAGKSSMRFAKIELEGRGLVIGDLIYIPNPAKNAVLELRIGDKPITKGTKVTKGTLINLVLGDGLSGVVVDVPMVLGKRLFEAIEILKSHNLNYNIFPDNSVTDSVNAVVYKQYPSAIDKEKLNYGEPVDLFIAPTLPDYILSDTAIMNKINGSVATPNTDEETTP